MDYLLLSIKKRKLNDFFNRNEIVFYDNLSDLAEKIIFYKQKDNLEKKLLKMVRKNISSYLMKSK